MAVNRKRTDKTMDKKRKEKNG